MLKSESDLHNIGLNLCISPSGEQIVECFSQVNPSEMLSALAGSALFVISRDRLQLWKQIVFAMISFVGGIFSAEMFSELMEAFLNAVLLKVDVAMNVRVPCETGALVASAICVTLLLRLLKVVRNHPNES